jgi:uncharacterized SAM-binding protein YcdF (DUF218 family)
MHGARTAVVVPGHGGVASDGLHRITARCLALVAHAERLAELVDPELVVFSGWSSTLGPSEAEQMRDAWRGAAVELVVEPTATSTAENASRTLPVLVQHGVAKAYVVCAPLHAARTRLLFGRIYGRAGVAVHVSVAHVRPSLHALAWELAALPLVPMQLRLAREELEGKSV